eukprot:PhM_4_TR14891/c0_g1_i1/m.93362
MCGGRRWRARLDRRRRPCQRHHRSLQRHLLTRQPKGKHHHHPPRRATPRQQRPLRRKLLPPLKRLMLPHPHRLRNRRTVFFEKNKKMNTHTVHTVCKKKKQPPVNSQNM